MTAWPSSPLAAVTRTPIRRSFRNHSTTCNAVALDDQIHSASEDAPGEHLLARFSEAARRFPGPAAAPALESGARPHGSHPFYYNSLMKAFSRAGRADQVLRLFREMKESDCQPTLACYGTVINALVIRNRPQEAVAVFEDMISSGMAPDLASYTILVKLYACHLKRFDSAYEVIRWMVRRGCDPDVVTYSTLITGLCRAGRVEEAWGVLDQMMEEGKSTPNAHTYTPILQFYCSKGRVRVAQRLLESMRSIGCPPDTVSYNVLIHGLCKIGSFREVEIAMRESTSKGWKPDAVTYNTYVNGLCKASKADEAFKQLEVMLAKGLCPTTVTLNILLDCLCRDQKGWEVKCLLERSYELELDVDVVSYNTLMTRLCEIGKGLAVLKLFADMFKKGVGPDTQTFNIVINSLCKARKLHEAKGIFDNKAFVADIVTYNILIHWFYVTGKLKELQLLLCDMHKNTIAPDTVTFNIVIDRLCSDGRFLEAINFVRSLEEGLSPNLVAHLAYWLVTSGNLGELLRLFEEILEQCLVLDGRIFEFLIRAFCRKGSCQSIGIHKVCLILDKMLGIG